MLDLQALEGYTHTLRTIVIAACVFAVCAYFPKLQYQSHLSKFPVTGGPLSGEEQRKKYLNGARQMYMDGYTKFKKAVFRIASADGKFNAVSKAHC